MKRVTHELPYILITIIASFLSAFGLHYFVFTAGFAPSGVDGIATMIQESFGINAGIISLLFNVPMLIIAYFVLKRRYVIYTLLFTFISSGLLMLFEGVGFPQYTDTTGGLIAAIFSGIILGVRTGLMLKFGASTGGVDIAAGIVQAKKPHLNIERVITVICYGISFISYFVYGNITSILLAFVQMFVFDKFAGSILKDRRNAIEVKIITKNPEPIKNDIIYKLKHGATILSSRGVYTDSESFLIISIINIRQIPDFLEIMKNYPDTFTYYDEVMGVKGNFRWKKDDIAK